MNLAIFGEDIKEYVKCRNVLRDSSHALYSLTWGQCSNLMRAKLGSASNYFKVDVLYFMHSLLCSLAVAFFFYMAFLQPWRI